MTILRTIAITILLLLPFFSITENIFAPETQIENQTFYNSFTLNYEMEKWIANGKNPNDFITQFDFQILWRTLARISLYIISIMLTYVLLKKSENKKWQSAMLNIFCFLGIVFCIMCLQTGFQNYYFPFMIPAIALAPIFWLGIALLSNKNAQEKLVNNG